jgi:hypothetical protein
VTDDAAKRLLRQEFFDAMDAGEVDFSDIVASTGPRHGDGSLKREGEWVVPPGTADR